MLVQRFLHRGRGLFIDRMEQNEELFAKCTNDKGFQRIVREHLLRKVYAEIREDDATDPAA